MIDILFGIVYMITLIILVSFILYVRIYRYNYFDNVAQIALLTALTVSILFIFLPTAPPWFTYYYGFNQSSNITIEKQYAAAGLWNLEKEIKIIPISNILWEFSSFKFGSFPSLHIIVSSHIYLILHNMKSKFKNYALILLILNSMGVVYLGHHYITDVLGGILLSYLIVKFSVKN